MLTIPLDKSGSFKKQSLPVFWDFLMSISRVLLMTVALVTVYYQRSFQVARVGGKQLFLKNHEYWLESYKKNHDASKENCSQAIAASCEILINTPL